MTVEETNKGLEAVLKEAHRLSPESQSDIIWLTDFDGVIANTVQVCIDGMLPELVKQNELMHKISTNLSYALGEILGLEKIEVAQNVVTNAMAFKIEQNMIEFMYEKLDAGDKVIVLTGNNHAEHIKQLMSWKGLGELPVCSCASGSKADIVLELVKSNEWKQVILVGDSPKEALEFSRKGISDHYRLFISDHNEMYAGLLRPISKAKSFDYNEKRDGTVAEAKHKSAVPKLRV